MKSLSKDLQTPKKSLDEFYKVTKRVLGHLPDIVSERVTARDYIILSSVVAGTLKYARPINNNLFIFDSGAFDTEYEKFLSVIGKIKAKKAIGKKECGTIDSVAYTIQQAMGVGMDFLCNPNSSRKHVGNRFEELIRLIVTELGVKNDKIVFKIPYPSEQGENYFHVKQILFFLHAIL